MSKILSDKTGDFQRWVAPSVEENEAANTELPVNAEELEAIQQQAHAKGYQMGRWEGMNSGREELEAQCGRLKQLMVALSHPLQQLDQQVEKELVLLAGAIAGQLVQREISTEPSILQGAVQGAVNILQSSARRVDVHLSPEDAALVGDSLKSPDDEQSWHLVSDPSLKGGDVIVKADNTFVDASLRTRLNQLIADMLKVDVEEVEHRMHPSADGNTP
ncbi:flagellar assembly protein FliH [bacterium SCSIO 12696]|nr:flagellar assembly protein FliH [bacterium SCSIO 12696]